MRNLIFLLCFNCCLKVLGQQSDIKGVVSIQNSETETGRRQYVFNAQVEDNYDKAQPALTDQLGKFKLVYENLPEKTTVFFHISKPYSNLEVVNIDALSAITGQTDSIKISMAPKERIAEYRKQIYKVGKTIAEQRLEDLIKSKNNELTALRKGSTKDTTKILQLERDLAKIEEQRKKIEKQAQDLANRYAPVNLDDASALFREAFAMFQRGNLDSALLVLNEPDLANKVSQILQERAKVTHLKEELFSRDSLQRQRSSDVAQALQFKADLHKTRYEFDSASHCHELLIKLDSNNADYLFYYANFLAWLNQDDKAISHYLKALTLYRNKSKFNPQIYQTNVATTQNNLGILYYNKNDFVNAEAALLEALDIRKRLATSNPQTFEPTIATTQNNLGILYLTKNDFTKAEAAFQEALLISKRLAVSDPQTYEPDVAITQNNLGMLYGNKKDFRKAEAAYLEALEIHKRLAVSDPQIYEPNVAATQANLGNLYGDTKEFTKAEAVYLEASEIYKRLAATNPQTYEPYFAGIKINLGTLYRGKKYFTKAEQAYHEAKETYKRLAATNPQTYEPYLALTQTNLGNLYSDKKEFTKAEAVYLEASETYKRLAATNPQTYEPYFAGMKNDLGTLYSETNDFTKAESVYLEALEIYNRLAIANSSYEPNVAMTQNNLGTLYIINKKYILAENFLIESLSIEKKWMKSYPDVYANEAIQTAYTLLSLYIKILDTLKQNAFKGAMHSKFNIVEADLNEIAKESELIKQKLSTYYGDCSRNLLFASKFAESELFAKKGLELDTSQMWIKVNLAHAQLFQGKYNNALKVYKELNLLINPEGVPYTTICLQDLEELQKNGITNKDITKIRDYFKEK